jgi:membrane protein DedA with SNARE-associated domain
MIEAIITAISEAIIWVISKLGYMGVVVSMAIESACIPLPSEIIMPFSGYLVWKGEMDLILVTLAGAFGNVIGSWVAYGAGVYGGRPFLEKYGRYVLLSSNELERSERWFAKYGDAAIFFSRLLPVIRTFISLPAGIARMNLTRFTIYTFLGSIPWCLGLAYIGVVFGEHWDILGPYFHKFDFLVGIILAVLVVLFIRKHWPQRIKSRKRTTDVTDL